MIGIFKNNCFYNNRKDGYVSTSPYPVVNGLWCFFGDFGAVWIVDNVKVK